MATFQCFFCADFVKCEERDKRDPKADKHWVCPDYKTRPQKTVKKGGKITVDFK